MKSFFRFWNELRRRNVPKGIISYVIFSWVLLQVISVLGSLVSFPTWLGKTILVSLLVIFPFWLIFIWFYDITTDGIKKTATIKGEIDEDHTAAIGKKLNIFILVFLFLAVVLLAVDRFRLTSEMTSQSNPKDLLAYNSIAVLPFNDMSSLKDQTYFADGLAEELLNSLSKIPEMQVISRTSAFSFKDTKLDIPSIAEKLKVNYILEGSVRTQDSIVRISVKLIETKKDQNLWVQSWDKDLGNIFKIQNEIAEAVANNMQLRIIGNDIPKVKEAQSRAYELYLKARHRYQNSNGDEGLLWVEEQLKTALSIDSTYAPAWSLLGKVYHSQNNFGLIDATEGYKLSNQASLRALKEDSTYGFTYSTLATIAIDYEKDIAQAERWANKGLQMEPNNADIIDSASEIAFLMGKSEKAIELNKKAILLDPINSFNYFMMANNYYYAEDFENSIKYAKESIRRDPNQNVIYATYAMALIKLKRYDEALEILKKEPLEGFRLHISAIIYHIQGNYTASEEQIIQLIRKYQGSFSYQIALTYAAIDKREEMYEWLDIAYEYQDLGLAEITIEPYFNPYKEDRRWKEFIQKIGYKYN